MPVLVKFSADYSDEFDCQQFFILDSMFDYIKWYDSVIRSVNEGSTEFYFGTNNYFGINKFIKIEGKSHLDTMVKCDIITDREAKIFEKYFGNHTFGTGPF